MYDYDDEVAMDWHTRDVALDLGYPIGPHFLIMHGDLPLRDTIAGSKRAAWTKLRQRIGRFTEEWAIRAGYRAVRAEEFYRLKDRSSADLDDDIPF